MTSARTLALLAALVAAVALAGCGVGAGTGSSDVQLVVTRDFGRGTVGQVPPEKAAGSETVMRFLQRNFDVRTKDGGGFVTAIDGLAGGREGGRPVDWFYYVNGIEAPKGAAATKLRAGDRVVWDRHDWGTTMRVPAIVGSFPEPFVNGNGGKRLAVRIECARGSDKKPCRDVADRLSDADVTSAQALTQTDGGEGNLRVVVGPWATVREDRAARLLELGPAASGVYARPARDGRTVALLDARGRTARTLGPGGGLVAATRVEDEQPTWIVTGTDARGLAAAVRALDEGALANRFALALDEGRGVALPVAPSS